MTGKQSEGRRLTPKQQAFVREYLIDLNATQAAKRAGYSVKTAHAVGHENLNKPEISDAIAKAQKERSEKTGITAQWVLERLADEATADLADILNDEGGLKPVSEWPLIWRQGLVAGIDIDELFEGQGQDREQVGFVKKIKLSDRIKRVELIGKHVGVQAFRDQAALMNPDGSPLQPPVINFVRDADPSQ